MNGYNSFQPFQQCSAQSQKLATYYNHNAMCVKCFAFFISQFADIIFFFRSMGATAVRFLGVAPWLVSLIRLSLRLLCAADGGEDSMTLRGWSHLRLLLFATWGKKNNF